MFIYVLLFFVREGTKSRRLKIKHLLTCFLYNCTSIKIKDGVCTMTIESFNQVAKKPVHLVQDFILKLEGLEQWKNDYWRREVDQLPEEYIKDVVTGFSDTYGFDQDFSNNLTGFLLGAHANGELSKQDVHDAINHACDTLDVGDLDEKSLSDAETVLSHYTNECGDREMREISVTNLSRLVDQVAENMPKEKPWSWVKRGLEAVVGKPVLDKLGLTN
jgi:hypothetical protein